MLKDEELNTDDRMRLIEVFYLVVMPLELCNLNLKQQAGRMTTKMGKREGEKELKTVKM